MKYKFVNSLIDIPVNTLLIFWDENYLGEAELVLQYEATTDEHDAYINFVQAVKQAVSDNVLPAKLGNYWYDWEDITTDVENYDEQYPKQYNCIFTPNDDEVVCTLFWKSGYADKFFAR